MLSEGKEMKGQVCCPIAHVVGVRGCRWLENKFMTYQPVVIGSSRQQQIADTKEGYC